MQASQRFGLGERARPGCGRVRLAPDMEPIHRPAAAFFQAAPRGRVAERPRAGAVPETFSRLEYSP